MADYPPVVHLLEEVINTQPIVQFTLHLPDKNTPPEQVRGFIVAVENVMLNSPLCSLRGESFSTLKHTFADGVYAREITVQAGALLTTAIHKYPHHVFVLKGRVTSYSEFGLQEIVGPCSFIAPAGIKRLCFVHEETVWTTVHAVQETDPEKIVELVTAKSYEEIGLACSAQTVRIDGGTL